MIFFSVLLSQQDSLAGGDVYQFKTPKKSGKMAQLAAKAITPAVQKVTSSKTPTSSKKKTSQGKKTPAASTRKKTLKQMATPAAVGGAENSQNLRRSARKRKPSK